MNRKVVREKDGFRLTWVKESKDTENHKWWHFFYSVAQMIVVESVIKTRKYTRSRIWVTTCKKCDFKKVEIREVWLPGEKIPEYHIQGTFDAVELAKSMNDLDETAEKFHRKKRETAQKLYNKKMKEAKKVMNEMGLP